jgi:hypothetical protein
MNVEEMLPLMKMVAVLALEVNCLPRHDRQNFPVRLEFLSRKGPGRLGEFPELPVYFHVVIPQIRPESVEFHYLNQVAAWAVVQTPTFLHYLGWRREHGRILLRH